VLLQRSSGTTVGPTTSELRVAYVLMKLVGVTLNTPSPKLETANTMENTLQDAHTVAAAILVREHYIFMISGKS